jgi:hypothetical protein
MNKRLSRLVVLVALIPAACSGQSATPSPTVSAAPATPAPTESAAPASPTASPSATLIPGADAAGILWLCMPGQKDNPCAGDLSTTVIDAKGNRTVETPAVATDPKIDCFYVYPTTSRQTGTNATIQIDPEERQAAAAQAALFSQVCKVYAPIYPQMTIAALNSGNITQAVIGTAYSGVKAAWQDYLANYNHGRGVVLIGDSQGAMMLAPLLNLEIDPDPELRRLMVSALLLGGNVSMPAAKDAVGNFKNIPMCTSIKQTGCVVGYSSFDQTPPSNAGFGRLKGALVMIPLPQRGAQEILCVNPAAPGGTGKLAPVFLTTELAGRPGHPEPLPATPYVSYPGQVSAQCKTDGDATWLQIARLSSVLPELSGSEGPSWGLHDLDVSLALGNLVELVRSEAAAYGS